MLERSAPISPFLARRLFARALETCLSCFLRGLESLICGGLFCLDYESFPVGLDLL